MSREMDLLNPKIRAKCQELIKLCKDKGIEIIISQTMRTKAEQDALYAQGRTKPGKIVTNVRYPNSMHCWGVAFDIAVIRGGKAIWDTAAYKPAGEMGESLGLVWGGRWKRFPDAPHFELSEYSIAGLKKAHGTPENFIKTWDKDGKENPGGGDNVPGFEKNTKVKYGQKMLNAGILDKKTYVEVRELAEMLGLKVHYDAVTKLVTLTK